GRRGKRGVPIGERPIAGDEDKLPVPPHVLEIRSVAVAGIDRPDHLDALAQGEDSEDVGRMRSPGPLRYHEIRNPLARDVTSHRDEGRTLVPLVNAADVETVAFALVLAHPFPEDPKPAEA